MPRNERTTDTICPTAWVTPPAEAYLRVLTQNMALDKGHNPTAQQRYTHLGHVILAAEPHLVFLQEVDLKIGLQVLEDTLQGAQKQYHSHVARVYPRREDRQGLTIISRIPLENHRLVGPYVGKHSFQAAQVTIGGHVIGMANIHPETPIHKELVRHRQLNKLAYHLSSLHDEASLMCGDFNSIDGKMPTIPMLKRRHGYHSAYQDVHGEPPAYTYPALSAQELGMGEYVTPHQLSQLRVVGHIARLFSKHDHELLRYTLDHILLAGRITAEHATVLDRNYTHGEFISDHFGLMADLTTGQSFTL